LAKKIAKKLKPGATVAFYGDLGSGKTTLIQFIAKALGVRDEITSPTFVIQKNYQLPKGRLIHIDCYRLESKKDAVELGFLDFLADKNSINLIEWAERIEEILPENTLEIHLKYLDQNRREYRIENIKL